MKNRISRGMIVLVVAIGASFAAAPAAVAQTAVEGRDLQLKKTYAKTMVTPTASIATEVYGKTKLFGPNTTVNCPKGGDCLLKIDATVQASVSVQETLYLTVRADGQDNVVPSAQLISTPDVFYYHETRGYTWYIEVTPGDHVVEVLGWTLLGLGDTKVDHGALTISVFK